RKDFRKVVHWIGSWCRSLSVTPGTHASCREGWAFPAGLLQVERSNQSTRGHRGTPAAGHNEVIQHADIDELEGCFQSTGDALIRLAWFRYSRRMVVEENHCRSVKLECLLHHHTRIHRSTVDGAVEQLPQFQHPV